VEPSGKKEEIMKSRKKLGQLGWLVRSALAVPLLVFIVVGAGTAGASAQSRAARDQASYDASLTRQVRHSLAMLPWYGVFDNLEYRVQGNEVMLYGQVVRPITKSDASGAVKRLEGVTKVVNDIQVLPLSRMDDQIRLAEYRSIFSEPSLTRYAMGAIPSIHIIVDSGHVTLEGIVDNGIDRNLATLRAEGVPDVFSVTNNLHVG
jgi:hyperosmotically inducible periplasmic protein